MASSVLRLFPADYRVMPWKNGQGTTAEIAVEPPATDGALDGFTWRLSIAEIGASGPFSRFPGYDRILVQIEGAPMTLSHEGGGSHRLRLREPHGFSGDVDTYGSLEAPPARDFNVIVRRDRASAVVSVHAAAAGEVVRAGGGVATRIVHLLAGEAGIEVDGELSPLGPHETLIAADADALTLMAATEGTVALVVAITPSTARTAPSRSPRP
jgi:environmental stress-induced protein Ves